MGMRNARFLGLLQVHKHHGDLETVSAFNFESFTKINTSIQSMTFLSEMEGKLNILSG